MKLKSIAKLLLLVANVFIARQAINVGSDTWGLLFAGEMVIGIYAALCWWKND